MKKIISTILLVVSAISGFTQTNTFPSSGNAGIGTTSPGAKLEIVGAVRLNPGATGYYAEHDYLGTTYNFGISEVSDNVRFNIAGGGTWTTGGGFNFQLAGSTKLRIHKDGNIGIGTTSPGRKLDVNGDANIATNLIVGSGIYNVNYYAGNSTATYFKNSGGATNMTLLEGGNVGIGTTSPGRKLDVNGDANIATNLIVGTSIYTNAYTAASTSSVNFKNSGGIDVITYLTGGNVGIGTVSPSEKLSVNGNIAAKKLIVTQTGWSDYVFDKDYKLRSLQNLEAYINQHKHLPEVPTAKEVKEIGINVGDNQALLLRKIEEMTLYIIQMDKNNKEMKAEIMKQALKIQKLENINRK